MRRRFDARDGAGHRESYRQVEAVRNRPGGRRVQRVGIRTSDPPIIRGRRVARRDRRRNRESQPLACNRQLSDVGDLQQDFLARGQVPDARLEDIGPLLVEQERAISSFNRIVVGTERVLALFDFPDDERAVDDGFEAADRRALFEREEVDRLDWMRFAVDVALRDRDACAKARDLRLDRNASEHDVRRVGGKETRPGGGGLFSHRVLICCREDRGQTKVRTRGRRTGRRPEDSAGTSRRARQVSQATEGVRLPTHEVRHQARG